MTLVESREKIADFSEPLKQTGPDLEVISAAVINFGTRENLVITSDSPGHIFIENGVRPFEIPHIEGQSSLQFEQWFLDVPPCAIVEQMTFGL